MKLDDDDPLDALVLRTAMQPPSGFAQTVMARVLVDAGAGAGAGAPTDAPFAVTRPSAWARLRNTSATLALAVGALASFSQVLMYVFGMWLATSTG
jgi:hypothetical protein